MTIVEATKKTEERARKILALHGCTFVEMVTECVVAWENKNGCQFAHDIFILNNIPENTWDYFCNLQ